MSNLPQGGFRLRQALERAGTSGSKILLLSSMPQHNPAPRIIDPILNAWGCVKIQVLGGPQALIIWPSFLWKAVFYF